MEGTAFIDGTKFVDQKSYSARGAKIYFTPDILGTEEKKTTRLLKLLDDNHWIYLVHGGLTVEDIMESIKLWIWTKEAQSII